MSDNSDALIGCLSVSIMILIGGAFCMLPKNATQKIVENAKEIIPTPVPSVEPTLGPADVLGHKTTLKAVFEVLKEAPVTPDQFNGMMSMAGAEGLPEPPEGWTYFKTKQGDIGLKKREDLTKKIKG